MLGEERKKPFVCSLRLIFLRDRGAPHSRPYFRIPPNETAHGVVPASLSSPKRCHVSANADPVNLLTANSHVHTGRPVDWRRQRAAAEYHLLKRNAAGASSVTKGKEIVHLQRRGSSITRGLAAELESFIFDHQRTGNSSVLVRATSGNVMLLKDLGNVRAATGQASVHKDTHGGKKHQEVDGRGGVIRELRAPTQPPMSSNSKELPPSTQPLPLSSNKEFPAATETPTLLWGKDPEELKEMGDAEYKKGRFEEAVALYDQAIAIDPRKAAYRTKKAAALMPLGRLLEAVAECRQAVSLEPAYERAHHRLANLLLRLGEAERVKHHYHLAGTKTSSWELEKATLLQFHVRKLNEAQRLRDWNTLLREAQSVISCGADSAPQIFAAQAEALLKLQRPQEADKLLTDAPIFDASESVKFYGASCSSYILSVRAQIDMANGRFDEAVLLAQQAVQVDPYNKDAKAALRRMQAVTASRSRGNELFKASKFSEACIAYNDGLDHDLNNSVLLCNRAACRMKLGQWKKAIEDCNLALQLRPSYKKARLRRADCYYRLEQWEASLEEYKLLMQQMPGDEEVMKGFSDVQYHIEKKKKSNVGDKNDEANVIIIKSNKQFMQIVEQPAASVVLFCDKSRTSQKMLQLMNRLSQRYLSVKFLLVDEEDLPYLVKQEEVGFIPSIRAYRKGSVIKDSAGYDSDQLEKLVRCLSS